LAIDFLSTSYYLLDTHVYDTNLQSLGELQVMEKFIRESAKKSKVLEHKLNIFGLDWGKTKTMCK
jgi:hypothetical protein